MRHVPASRPILFGVLTLLCCGVDLYSKERVFDTLGYEGVRSDWHEEWFDGAVRFELLTSFNGGALWGIGQGYSWLFASLSVAAAVGVLWWLFIAGAARSLWLTIALALVTGGALGNLYDRLGLHGCTDADGEVRLAVRDFLLFEFGGWGWPVFNFADVFLVTGAIMLALQSLAPPREDEHEAHADDPAAQPAAAAPTGG
ncbi:signal peptidase II [Alienimonas californiensis]|uniref:Lipoprotein signal peptidase n=1 Tax=Alienimonas californiensis TaxID=2527989 RepID=A0A517PDP3_9PLAN|nr:signal peptidase II [Alienimonas californiensis]QDT17490.1 Lipoprotein signal peptidase [Alienimonas californiensis]